MKLKNLLTGLVLAYSVNASANPFVSAEIGAMNERSVLDFKLGGDISDKVGFFSRNIIKVTPKDVSYFGLMDLVFPLRDGLDLFLEAQYIQGTGAVPRLGLQYFKDLRKDLNIYASYTAALNGEYNSEVVLDFIYEPKITDKLGLAFSFENVTNFGPKEHNFSLQRIRPGIKIDNIKVGPALDLSEDSKFSYNLGFFVRVDLK